MTKKEAKVFMLQFNTDKRLNPSEHEAIRVAIKALEQEPCEDADVRYIYTQGLEEGIRCAMCTNSMKSDRGCDGGCVVDNVMYKKVMDTIQNHIFRDKGIIKALEQEPKWIPVSERLPKEYLCDDGYVEPSDYVLVWGDHGNYGISRYWGNRRSKSENPNTYKDWMDLDWVAQKPIAWMPLPEPYKESEE